MSETPKASASVPSDVPVLEGSGAPVSGAPVSGASVAALGECASPEAPAVLPKPTAAALTRLQESVRGLLEAVGEDPAREGLRETPERVARLYLDMFSGLYEDPRQHLYKQFSADNHGGPVIVKDIPFQSVCEHHLLPVRGKAAVAYLPEGGRLTGLSKLARLVEGYARRPQLQERLTDQVVAALVEVLRPRAVLVVLEAEHMCMTLRGVRAPGSQTITMGSHGLWAEDAAARVEILSLMR